MVGIRRDHNRGRAEKRGIEVLQVGPAERSVNRHEDHLARECPSLATLRLGGHGDPEGRVVDERPMETIAIGLCVGLPPEPGHSSRATRPAGVISSSTSR